MPTKAPITAPAMTDPRLLASCEALLPLVDAAADGEASVAVFLASLPSLEIRQLQAHSICRTRSMGKP